MRIRIFAIIVVLSLVLSLMGGVVFANQIITIHIDGKQVESDVAPQLVSGHTMVPLRAVSEGLGADVQWFQESMRVDITSPGQKFLDDYTDKGMYIKSASHVLSMYNTGTALVLDVRTESLRGEGYIDDSMHIPLFDLLHRINEIPVDKTIAVYSSQDIEASYAVAILNMQGYNAYLLENGIDGWIVAGGNTIWPCPTKT